jgi:hypothetical protein
MQSGEIDKIALEGLFFFITERGNNHHICYIVLLVTQPTDSDCNSLKIRLHSSFGYQESITVIFLIRHNSLLLIFQLHNKRPRSESIPL